MLVPFLGPFSSLWEMFFCSEKSILPSGFSYCFLANFSPNVNAYLFGVGVFFSYYSCSHPSLSSLYMHFIHVISYGCFRKNNNFRLGSDLIIAQLRKIKQLRFEMNMGEGLQSLQFKNFKRLTEIQNSEGNCNPMLFFLFFSLYFSICVYWKLQQLLLNVFKGEGFLHSL